MLVADDQGSPVEDEWYPPFGSPPGYGTELFAERGYTGQRFDIVPELYYYGARWYDPYLGQSTQPDALVPDPLRPIAWNRYAYAYNSPLVYSDPRWGALPGCRAANRLITVTNGTTLTLGYQYNGDGVLVA